MGAPILLRRFYEGDGVDGYQCASCRGGFSLRGGHDFSYIKSCLHCGCAFTKYIDCAEARHERLHARFALDAHSPPQQVWELQFTERHQHPEWENDDYQGWITAQRCGPDVDARYALAYSRAFVRAWDERQRREYDEEDGESYKDDHFYSIVKVRLVRVREDADKLRSPPNEYYGFAQHEIPLTVRCLSRTLIREEEAKLEARAC